MKNGHRVYSLQYCNATPPDHLYTRFIAGTAYAGTTINVFG